MSIERREDIHVSRVGIVGVDPKAGQFGIDWAFFRGRREEPGGRSLEIAALPLEPTTIDFRV